MIRSVVLPNIPGNVSGHLFRSIWATTRCMKKAGWKFKGSSGEVPYVNRVFYSFAGLTLPRAQIDVEDAIVAGWPNAGVLLVSTVDAGWQIVKYTGRTVSYNWRFTGCTGGTGTLISRSMIVSPAQTTIAAGSNGASLPQATIHVAATAGLLPRGTVLMETSDGWVEVTYTGVTGTVADGLPGRLGGHDHGRLRAVAPHKRAGPAARRLGRGRRHERGSWLGFDRRTSSRARACGRPVRSERVRRDEDSGRPDRLCHARLSVETE